MLQRKDLSGESSSRSTAILIQSALNSGNQRLRPSRDSYCQDRASPRNGNWPPHLHLQVISHRMGWKTDFPGVALPSEQSFWKRSVQIPIAYSESRSNPGQNPAYRGICWQDLHIMGRNLSLSYKEPPPFYGRDASGRRFVDCVNNVTHVGHCHPKVVEPKENKVATQHKHPLPSP